MSHVQPHTRLEDIFRLQPVQKVALRKLGLHTTRDLLYYLPARYGDQAKAKHIQELQEGDLATICGKVVKSTITKAYVRKIPIAEIILEDATGKVRATWFHQAYMAKKVPEGGFARITGAVSARKSALYFANPQIEAVESLDLMQEGSLFATGDCTVAPVYPESRGVSSLWLRHHIQRVLKAKVHELLIDPIPPDLLARYHLPALKTALVWIHAPHREADARAARKRFAFEEIFLIQLARQQARLAYQANPAFTIAPAKSLLQAFTKRFPFEPTVAQERAVAHILRDFKAGKPMTRLLEGDVGSGKTAVAATAAFAAISTPPKDNRHAHLQVGYMAPTEILAKQHFESFIQYFTHTGVSMGLITGTECRKFPSKSSPGESTHISKPQLLKWVANGEISILIGTHALIQKTVQFKNISLVIVDEQHRFGVHQRLQLAQKHTHTEAVKSKKLKVKSTVSSTTYNLPPTTSCVPHLLSMTATPIPRTLALTIYGDLDLTLLDQMPAGRKPILTKIVLPALREEMNTEIRAHIKDGRQLYVICPRIDPPSLEGYGRAGDPDTGMLQMKSVVEEAARLRKSVFQDCSIGIVHSKLLPKEKDKVMADFSAGLLQILVATSVVEVGVNVPNATMIIIEGAERFGLAQLHQLRGRVLRSSHQAYCYVFTESKTAKTVARLRALTTAANGFELAERDLELRGAGELGGRKQWGISDIGMEAIKNIKMVEAAREAARTLLSNDPELKQYPHLTTCVASKNALTHFE